MSLSCELSPFLDLEFFEANRRTGIARQKRQATPMDSAGQTIAYS
jgi:hypothetical protein